MIWGDQWLCPCGTHNLFLRKKCRDCGEAKLPDEKLEPALAIMGGLMKREMDLTPRLVICRQSADYYDAELAFDNAHYIVVTGCRTRELALAAGQPHLRTLVKALRRIGLATVAPYPKAKA
jgi:hypothetical protein